VVLFPPQHFSPDFPQELQFDVDGAFSALFLSRSFFFLPNIDSLPPNSIMLGRQNFIQTN